VVEADKPGLVYVATRRAAEDIAAELRERGVRARAYHAGMKAADRDAAQEAFMADEVDAMVATIAFGMGVDKPNVRWVFHASVSDSVDAYYQEIGRGGRDGKPARAILFYRPEDLGLRRFFAGSGQVELDEIGQVLTVVRERDAPVEPAELQAETDLSQTKLTTAVSRLEEAGAVEVLRSGEVAPAPDAPPVSAGIRAAAEAEEKRRSFDRSRVDMMRGYAETDGCRRAFVLSYFGEPFSPPCGNCDNCLAGRVRPDVGRDLPFEVGARVAHPQWGEGVVQRYDDDAMVVLFDEVGYKTLALEVVRSRALLSAA
jgi:ATP-dependent DNA helicase RecQ